MSVSTNITTFIDTESRTGLVRGWGRGGELVFNGLRVSVLWMIGDDSCTTLGIYLMPWICTFKNGQSSISNSTKPLNWQCEYLILSCFSHSLPLYIGIHKRYPQAYKMQCIVAIHFNVKKSCCLSNQLRI